MRRDRRFLLGAIAAMEPLPRTPERRIALAEAEFRLAIAPDTPTDEGVDRLGRAVDHDPFLAKAHLHRGRLLHRTGRQRAALGPYRQAIRLAPGSRRAYILLALALLGLGKPERAIGERLLDTLAAGEPSAQTLADVDALLAAAGTDDVAGARPTGPRQRTPAATGGSAPDAWHAALIDQIARPKPDRRRVEAHLTAARRSGDSDPGPFATACVLMMVGGETTASVRRLADQADLATHRGHPAVVMVDTALTLADVRDPAELVPAIVDALRRRAVPPELACWLYYARHEAAPPPVAEAVRLLDSFPPWIQALDPFVELRVAIIDHCARRAWTDKRFDLARLLWHEARSLAPHRVPIAVNLALVAARTAAVEEYRPAWEHLAEVLYLNSAGTGDVRFMLDERISLHRALSQQSFDRYRADATHPDRLTDDDLAAWVADPDTVEVWLREWDLYYLNARLRFRSPVHLLSVPADASAEARSEARDILVRHVDIAVAAQRWAGARIFADLVTTHIDNALRDAPAAGGRTPDPFHDREKKAADTLADEVLQRVVTLYRLSSYLAYRRPSMVLALGAAVATRQFALPLTVVQQICRDRGIIDGDETLSGIFARDLTAIAATWNTPPTTGPAAYAARIADLHRCVAAAPHLVAVRTLLAEVLHTADRPEGAYRVAVEALSLPPSPDERPEDDTRNRADLVALVDRIGGEAVPDTIRRGYASLDLNRSVANMRAVVNRYPRSAAARLVLVDLLLDADQREAAVHVLEDGVRQALDDRQRRRLQERLRQAAAG